MKKITLFFTLLAFSFGFAQNGGDTCGAAVAVTAGTITGTTITQDSAGSEMGTGGDSAFFVFTAPSDGTLIVSSCITPGVDTYLSIGEGACGSLSVLDQDDDACDAPAGLGSVAFTAVVSGNDYIIEWDDRYGSGANTFDWLVEFIACAPPVATVAVVDDCANSQFSIDVNITDLGGNGALSITNSANSDVVDVDSGIGVYTAGPFPIGTPVSISIVGDDTDCDVSSAPLADTCPPANDECTGAIAIACDGNYTGSTTGATDSGGNPANDVWFSYTGSGTAEDVTLDLCPSGYDTAVRVYTDCPGTNQIAFNDDSCGTRSQLTFASDGTSTYYIMVEGWNNSSGNFDMTVTCAANIPAPANDLCANAEALTLDTPASGTTAGATDSTTGGDDDTTCEPFTFKADVWYSFVAPADGDVGIMTSITGTSDQASVAVYPDCNQLDADSIACSAGNGGEIVNVTGLTDGVTYYVRVWSDGVAARQGNFRIEGTFDITVSDATLSTEDFDTNGDLFSYYPNPVTNTLTLNAQNSIQNVSVFNMLGQQVMRTAPNAVNSEVDMTTLNPGAYFVQVTINNTTETIRVIKN